MVESIVGALYISDDFSPIGVEAFFNKVLKPFYNRHITLKTISHHPTKILFELVQAGGCKEFQIIREDNEDGPCCLGKVLERSALVMFIELISDNSTSP